MKRYTLFIAAFVAAFTLVAGPAFSAGYVTPKIDLGYGFGDWTDNFDLNPMIGAGVILGFNVTQSISIEGTFAFQYWVSDYEDVTYYHVRFMFGARFAIGNFGLLGGVGGVYRNLEITGSADTTEFGFYFGADVVFSNVMLRCQYVYTNDGDWSGSEVSAIELSVGYKFGV